MKLYDLISDREGSESKQRKHYFKGIGAYEVDHLSLPTRMGKVIYSGFEKALAWFVLRKYPSRLLIIVITVIGMWTKTSRMRTIG